MYLHDASLKPAAEFVSGAAWQDMERAAMERRPPEPEPDDLPHVAAAKAYTRKGFEIALLTLRKLPFDPKPVEAEAPYAHIGDPAD